MCAYYQENKEEKNKTRYKKNQLRELQAEEQGRSDSAHGEASAGAGIH
jgi:hypothetical protein